jgi:hypothetical protein
MWVYLNLYITGMTPRSARAIENVRAFCAQHLQGRHTLRIFDICWWRSPATVLPKRGRGPGRPASIIT